MRILQRENGVRIPLDQCYALVLQVWTFHDEQVNLTKKAHKFCKHTVCGSLADPSHVTLLAARNGRERMSNRVTARKKRRRKREGQKARMVMIHQRMHECLQQT